MYPECSFLFSIRTAFEMESTGGSYNLGAGGGCWSEVSFYSGILGGGEEIRFLQKTCCSIYTRHSWNGATMVTLLQHIQELLELDPRACVCEILLWPGCMAFMRTPNTSLGLSHTFSPIGQLASWWTRFSRTSLGKGGAKKIKNKKIIFKMSL